MSLHNLRSRTEAILRKYEQYDTDGGKDQAASSGDPFMDEYQEVEAEVEKLIEAANDIQLETSRAVIAQMNAEIRMKKQVLLTDAVEALQKKVKKGKGVSKELIKERQVKIQEIIDKIYTIPDGMSSGPRRPQRAYLGSGAKGGKVSVILDVEAGTSNKPHMVNNPLWWQNTAETQAFEKGWDQSKIRQDKALDNIERGVGRLKEIATNAGEELNRQAPVIDDIEKQIDKVSAKLQSNNAKLKGLVTKMRSSRNFCVDVILICIILAIGAYIYSMFK